MDAGHALVGAHRHEVVVLEDILVVLDERERAVVRDVVLDLDDLVQRALVLVTVVAAGVACAVAL
jgi:hypothetical protein